MLPLELRRGTPDVRQSAKAEIDQSRHRCASAIIFLHNHGAPHVPVIARADKGGGLFE